MSSTYTQKDDLYSRDGQYSKDDLYSKDVLYVSMYTQKMFYTYPRYLCILKKKVSMYTQKEGIYVYSKR